MNACRVATDTGIYWDIEIILALIIHWNLEWDFVVLENNTGIILGTYFDTLKNFQIVIKFARVIIVISKFKKCFL